MKLLFEVQSNINKKIQIFFSKLIYCSFFIAFVMAFSMFSPIRVLAKTNSLSFPETSSRLALSVNPGGLSFFEQKQNHLFNETPHFLVEKAEDYSMNRQKKIIPLLRIVESIERKFGGTVLDAQLVKSNAQQISTWYYNIKHRSTSGSVTFLYYSATTGREL